MEPTKNRFSFTEAAAQAPTRQRFSFTQKPKSPSLDSFFPSKSLVQGSSVTHTKKPWQETAKEFVAPSRGYEFKPSEPFKKGEPLKYGEREEAYLNSSFKDKAVATGKWTGEMALGLSQLSRFALEKIPGYKKLVPADEEFVAGLYGKLQPSSKEEAAVMQGIDYMTLGVGSTGRKGLEVISKRILKTKTAEQAAKIANTVTKDAARAKQITLDIVKADTKEIADQLAKKLEREAATTVRMTSPASKTKIKMNPTEVAAALSPDDIPLMRTIADGTIAPQTYQKVIDDFGLTGKPRFDTDVFFTKVKTELDARWGGIDDALNTSRSRPGALDIIRKGEEAITKADDYVGDLASINPSKLPTPVKKAVEKIKVANPRLADEVQKAFNVSTREDIVDYLTELPDGIDPSLASKLKKEELLDEFLQRVPAERILDVMDMRPPKTKGFFASAAENLRNPATRQGGHIGASQPDFPQAGRKSLSSTDDSIRQGELTGVKDITGREARIGDTIEFEALLGEKKGQTKIFIDNEGNIIGNGLINNGIPFKVVDDVTPHTSKVKEAVTPPATPAARAEDLKQTQVEVSKKHSGVDTSKDSISLAHTNIEGLAPVKNVPSKSLKFAKENKPPIDIPEQTLWHKAIENIQDQAQRLGFYQKTLRKSGRTIDEGADAMLQQEAFVGRASARIGAIHDYLGLKSTRKNGLFNRMRRDDIMVDQLSEYMAAKNAHTRNARVAKLTDGKVPDGGSGLTNKEADAILAKYADNPKMEAYSKEFRENVIDGRLQALKEYGLYSDEQIAKITAGEPNYVPAKVEFTKKQGGFGSGLLKGLKGSARKDRTNAVEQAVADFESTIQVGERNRVRLSLKKLMDENPNTDLWETNAVKSIPQYNAKGELQIFRPVKSKDPNTFSVYKNGKEFEITIKDDALANVFTKQGQQKPVEILVGVNNYLRAVNTFMAPEFMVTNAVRDLQTALVIAGGEKGAVTAAKMVKDYPSAMKGIWQSLRKGKNTGWAKTYNEMKMAGGETGWFDVMEVSERTRKTSKRIERYNGTKTSDSLARALDSTGQLIHDVNSVTEMSVRVSAYKQLVDGGMSATKAANYAKNMTVNFNKHGNYGLLINSLYLFANAGIQGSARLLMALKYKGVRRAVYGITASSYAINEMNERTNPEGFKRIQDFEKERNMIIMLPLDGNKYNIPGVTGDPRNGYYMKIPLPYGFNVFKVLGDQAYNVTNGKKDMSEAMVDTLKSFDAAFNPLSSGTPTQFVSPTVTDPFISLWENKNWFGAPIMPEQPAFAPPVRDSDRYFSGARDLSVSAATYLNRVTGGNEVSAGAVDISPESIDHWIDTLGGSLGNFIGTSLDGTVSAAQGDLPDFEELPFARKFLDKPFETGEQSILFETLDQSATRKMSQIEISRFADNTVRAYEMGQIDEDTLKRVTKQFIDNNTRQYAGEIISLINEGKSDEAMKVLESAPPGLAKELNKLVKADVEREIKRLERE